MDDVHLRGRNFLKLLDFSHDEIFHLLDIATDLKIKSKKGVWPGELERKKIAYVSREASALTKVSCRSRDRADLCGTGCVRKGRKGTGFRDRKGIQPIV